MTTISSAQHGGSILLRVPPNDGSIIPLYTCGIAPRTVAQKSDPGFVAMAGFVSSLRCTATINSLPEAEVPQFEVTDSESQRAIKALDVAWKSPRRQIDLLYSQDAINWERVHSVPLLNPLGYPFTTQDLLSLYTQDTYLEIPDGSAIAIQVFEVKGEYVDEESGSLILYDGFLDEQDEVIIWGSWLEEISYKSLSGGGAGGGGISEQAGLLRGSIIEKTGAGGLLAGGYEIGTPVGQTGSVTVGYYVLGNFLNVYCYGGGATNPTLKKLQVLDAWEPSRVLVEVTAGEFLGGQDRMVRDWGVVDTSTHAGKTALLKIVNEDTDPNWGILAIDSNYVFSED